VDRKSEKVVATRKSGCKASDKELYAVDNEDHEAVSCAFLQRYPRLLVRGRPAVAVCFAAVGCLAVRAARRHPHGFSD
jgi:hypothetical protein